MTDICENTFVLAALGVSRRRCAGGRCGNRWKVLCIKLNNAHQARRWSNAFRHYCPLRQRPVRRLEFGMEGFMHKT